MRQLMCKQLRKSESQSFYIKISKVKCNLQSTGNLLVSLASKSRDIVTDTRGSQTGKKRHVIPNTFYQVTSTFERIVASG